MINKEDIKEVLEGIKEEVEDLEFSIGQLLREKERESEALIDPVTKEITRDEDTDEELIYDIESASDEIKDGLQALWVAVNSYIQDKGKS